jgi:glucan-binding YG repeat protein
MLEREWALIDGYYYYFSTGGSMSQNTWVQSRDVWYFVDAAGKMLTNTYVKTVDASGTSHWWWFDESGAWNKKDLTKAPTGTVYDSTSQ